MLVAWYGRDLRPGASEPYFDASICPSDGDQLAIGGGSRHANYGLRLVVRKLVAFELVGLLGGTVGNRLRSVLILHFKTLN